MPESPRPDLLLPTAGACMRPWIWPGGVLGIEYCKASDLSPGDIAVWFDGRRLKSHRVVAVEPGGGFITRGDLAAVADPAVSDPELVGRAVSFEKNGIRYRLDRGLPRIAGGVLARTGWCSVVFIRARGLMKRALSRTPRR